MEGDLSVEEAENLRRSVAMLPPCSCCYLKREMLLRILGQLVRTLETACIPDRRASDATS